MAMYDESLLPGKSQRRKGAIAERIVKARTWVVHFIERDSFAVTCIPEATQADVLARYPQAVAAEPQGEISNEHSATTANDAHADRKSVQNAKQPAPRRHPAAAVAKSYTEPTPRRAENG